MQHDIDIQFACDDDTPDEESFRRWATAALAEQSHPREMTIRLVNEEEIRQLNRDYRGKDYATNVLSFEVDLPPELDLPLLGDIIICPGVVRREAIEQHKPLDAHWAHMVIHGTLHLQGYDHINDSDAEVMESLEIAIMKQLGYADPYNNGAQHPNE
ncbi:MAG TPA: rRNA maturation RNase YbeY [Pseudomonadales bacterium]|nr:rRNA maturation RNase YbeY [Pseudomonadales bacterium]